MELKVITEKKALLPTSQEVSRAAQPFLQILTAQFWLYASKPSAQCLQHFASSKNSLASGYIKTSAHLLHRISRLPHINTERGIGSGSEFPGGDIQVFSTFPLSLASYHTQHAKSVQSPSIYFLKMVYASCSLKSSLASRVIKEKIGKGDITRLETPGRQRHHRQAAGWQGESAGTLLSHLELGSHLGWFFPLLRGILGSIWGHCWLSGWESLVPLAPSG